MNTLEKFFACSNNFKYNAVNLPNIRDLNIKQKPIWNKIFIAKRSKFIRGH